MRPQLLLVLGIIFIMGSDDAKNASETDQASLQGVWEVTENWVDGVSLKEGSQAALFSKNTMQRGKIVDGEFQADEGFMVIGAGLLIASAAIRPKRIHGR